MTKSDAEIVREYLDNWKGYSADEPIVKIAKELLALCEKNLKLWNNPMLYELVRDNSHRALSTCRKIVEGEK